MTTSSVSSAPSETVKNPAAPAAPTTVPAVQSPTVGRRVWYRPSAEDRTHGMTLLDEVQALDAGVLFVHDDRCVNLQITDHLGSTFFRACVPLLQADDAPPTDRGYAEWMPYQKSVAAGAVKAPA